MEMMKDIISRTIRFYEWQEKKGRWTESEKLRARVSSLVARKS